MSTPTELHTPSTDTRTSPQPGSRDRTSARDRRRAFIERARKLASALPRKVEDNVRAHPYGAIGVACGVGVGLGVVLGSRVLRHAVAGAVSVAVVELVRKLVVDDLDRAFPSTRVARAEEHN